MDRGRLRNLGASSESLHIGNTDGIERNGYGRKIPALFSAATPVFGERVRGVDLRSCVVSATAAGNRIHVCVVGNSARDVHGRVVHRQPWAAVAADAATSASSLWGAGIRDRRLRDPRAVRPSLPESRLHQRRGAWFAGNDPACPAGRNLHIAADDSDGRFAAGDRPVDQEDAGRDFLVGLSLRRQYGRCSVRVPCGGILPATDLQYCDGDLVCSCDEHCRGGRQPADGAARSCPIWHPG